MLQGWQAREQCFKDGKPKTAMLGVKMMGLTPEEDGRRKLQLDEGRF